MIRIRTTIFIFLLSFACFSQRLFRGPIWFPEDTTTIIGLSLELNARGDAHSCSIFGVNFEFLGTGILLPLAPNPLIREDKNYVDSILRQERSLTINGINISPLGLCSEVTINGLNLNGIASYAANVNGIQVALITNAAQNLNGVQLAVFGNEAGYFRGLQIAALVNVSTVASWGLQISVRNRATNHHGIQIGLFNRSDKIKGLQIGLWNRNDKRRLPIINW